MNRDAASVLLAARRRRAGPWRQPSNVLAYEADIGVVQSAGSLVSWDDAGGRSFQLTHGNLVGSTATAFGWTANDGDGMPALLGNGASRACGRIATIPGGFDTDNPHTVMAVVRDANAQDSGVYSIGELGTGRHLLRYSVPSTNLISQLFSDTSQNCEPLRAGLDGGWHVVWHRRGTTQAFVGIDGAEGAGVNNPTGNFLPDRLVIGAYTAGGGALISYFFGKVRALAVFNADIGAARIQQVRAYWKKKWPGLP